jgi:branched-chain amino acid aminotransferase
MEEIIYLNGNLVPRSQACLSVYDHGLLYGYALFETMRAYNGRIFLLDRHLRRLMDGALVIGLASVLEGIDLGRACLQTLRANRLTEARVRLTATNGSGDVLPWSEIAGKPTVIITARPYVPFPAETYRKGFKIGVASQRRPAQSPMARIKSNNYLINVMARMETAKHGLDEALLLNDRGLIAEGGNSNIFFVHGERLITPSLDSGILPGITRELVLELATQLDIKIIEGSIRLSDLFGFDEVFMTSSVIEIMPVVAVTGETGRVLTIGAGTPGKVTIKLLEAYKTRVTQETGY